MIKEFIGSKSMWLIIGFILGIILEWISHLIKLSKRGLFAEDGHLYSYQEIKEKKEASNEKN